MLPLIGITSSVDEEKRIRVPAGYAAAVEAAGGIPVVLPVLKPERAPEVLSHLHGLLLSGGVDVDPSCVEPGSRLAAILGVTEARVNSFHHQAVREVPSGLRAVAWAPDGVIEAVEAPDHRFVMGLQWHPEEMWRRDPLHLKPFAALVEAAHTRLPRPEAQRSRAGRRPGAGTSSTWGDSAYTV